MLIKNYAGFHQLIQNWILLHALRFCFTAPRVFLTLVSIHGFSKENSLYHLPWSESGQCPRVFFQSLQWLFSPTVCLVFFLGREHQRPSVEQEEAGSSDIPCPRQPSVGGTVCTSVAGEGMLVRISHVLSVPCLVPRRLHNR